MDNKIGDRIKISRKLKNITQEELAESLKVSRQSVSKWESNLSIPDIEKILQLSEYFQVSTDYLLKGINHTEQFKTIEPTSQQNYKKRNYPLIISLIATTISSSSLFIIWVLSKIYRFNNLPYNPATGKYRVGVDAFTYVYGIKEFFTIMIVTLIIGIIATIIIVANSRKAKRTNRL